MGPSDLTLSQAAANAAANEPDALAGASVRPQRAKELESAGATIRYLRISLSSVPRCCGGAAKAPATLTITHKLTWFGLFWLGVSKIGSPYLPPPLAVSAYASLRQI